MTNKIITILIFLILFQLNNLVESNENNNSIKLNNIEGYGIQWSYNFGSNWEGGRFQGSQPIGDCDNDGKNEIN